MRYHIDDIVLHHERQSVFAGEVELARLTLAVLGEISTEKEEIIVAKSHSQFSNQSTTTPFIQHIRCTIMRKC